MSTRSMLTPSPKEKPQIFSSPDVKKNTCWNVFFKHTTRNNVFQCIAFCFVFLLLAVYIHNISIHILTFAFVCWAEANDCWCASAKVFESVQLSLSQSYKWPFKDAAFDPRVRKSVATKACLSGISELNKAFRIVPNSNWILLSFLFRAHRPLWNLLKFFKFLEQNTFLFLNLITLDQIKSTLASLKSSEISAICGVTVSSVALVSSFIGSSGISPSTRMFA